MSNSFPNPEQYYGKTSEEVLEHAHHLEHTIRIIALSSDIAVTQDLIKERLNLFTDNNIVIGSSPDEELFATWQDLRDSFLPLDDEIIDRTEELETRILVRAVMLDEHQRVLLIKRSQSETFLPGRWELPAGGREPKEGPNKALERELDEELGLIVECRNIPIYSTSTFSIVRDDQITEDWVNLNYLLNIESDPHITLSKDHDEYCFVQVHEALETYLINDDFGQGARHALLSLPQTS